MTVRGAGPAPAPQVSLPDLPDPTYLDVDGQSLAYVDTGDGPAVVLVHGNPTWSYLWRSLLGPLRDAGFRALAPDHIGMGRSARPGPGDYPFTLSRRIADFGRFIDAVSPDAPVSLVVHDWGGPIALGWAVDNPDRVDRLVLLNTAAFPFPPGKSMPWPLRLARLRPIGPALIRHANAFVRLAMRFGVVRRLPSDVRSAYARPYDRADRREAIVRFVQDIPTSAADPAHAPLQHTEAHLHRLAGKPTLICWGMRDIVFDEPILARFEQLLPHARTVRIAEGGHYVSEDAEPLLAELLPAFLSEGSATGEPGDVEPPVAATAPQTIDLRDETPSPSTH